MVFDVTGKTSPVASYIWTNDKGDRFIFPSYIVPLDDNGDVSEDYDEIKNHGLSRNYQVNQADVWGCVVDREMTVFDLEFMPHVVASVYHPNMFAATDVYMIGGPQFDAIASESN